MAPLAWPLAFPALLLCFRTYVQAQCNPLQGSACTPVPGLANSSYFVDFTQQSATPADWIQANYETVTYGSDGAEFALAKQGDAPYIWTNFYFLFGRVDVVMQAAPGTGVISSAVLMSDDLDEIDWEFSGNNFGNPGYGLVQTNYFGKGITGNYDRGTLPHISDPTTGFHTYSLDWSATQLVWSVDGTVVRTLPYSAATSGAYQYPQTPSRLHLGLWDAGDPNLNGAVVSWAGGYTDLTKLPYTAYVKSVKITPSSPCASYVYGDKSGSYKSIHCNNATLPISSSLSSAALSGTTASVPVSSATSATTIVVPATTSLSSTLTSKVSSSPSSSSYIPSTSTHADLSSSSSSLASLVLTSSSQASSSSVFAVTTRSTVSSNSISSPATSTTTSTVSKPSASSSSDTSNSSAATSRIVSTPSNTPVPVVTSSIVAVTTSSTSTSKSTTASASASAVIPATTRSSPTQSTSAVIQTTPKPISTTTPKSTPTTTSKTTFTITPAPSAKCNQDNCLRGMFDSRYALVVPRFCSRWLATATAPADIPQVPAYLASGCQNNFSRVSSACKCVPTPSAMATVFTPGAHQPLRRSPDGSVTILAAKM